MFKTKEVTLVDRLRSIQRSDKANKQCANCGELGPVYICSDFHTFVCTDCSGLHRELSHKVKSISMSNWTKEEVDALETSGGNAGDKAKYMSGYDPRVYPQPQGSNRDRLRDFLRAKYIERRWASASQDRAVSDVHKENKGRLAQSKSEQSDLLNFASFSAETSVKPEVSQSNFQTVVLEQSAEESAQVYFSRGLEALEKVFKSDPALARNLAASVIDSLNKQFSKSRNPSPQETPLISSSMTMPTASTVMTANPFDMLPGLAQTSSMNTVSFSPQFSSAGFGTGMTHQPPQILPGTARPEYVHKNPFDDLLQ